MLLPDVAFLSTFTLTVNPVKGDRPAFGKITTTFSVCQNAVFYFKKIKIKMTLVFRKW